MNILALTQNHSMNKLTHIFKVYFKHLMHGNDHLHEKNNSLSIHADHDDELIESVGDYFIRVLFTF